MSVSTNFISDKIEDMIAPAISINYSYNSCFSSEFSKPTVTRSSLPIKSVIPLKRQCGCDNDMNCCRMGDINYDHSIE